jgi:hypothetical protein
MVKTKTDQTQIMMNYSLKWTNYKIIFYLKKEFYNHGHYFVKKTFHKPIYCHHCAEMLWGLIGQGFVCEGNFIALTWPIQIVNKNSYL